MPADVTLQDVAAVSAASDSDPLEHARRKHAMLIDSDPRTAAVVAGVMEALQGETLLLQSAEEAIARFAAEQPDIVFVGAQLSGIDGFEAARLIKQLAGGRFVPVILVADDQDAALLSKCIESGADDFVLKPLKASTLSARILVMERICKLQQHVAARKRTISALLERERAEQALAERVLSRAVKDRNVVMDRIGLMLRPAAIFSGDIVLTQHLPDGGLRVLLGDFTGHGLAAAVAALPIADAFHTMTRKGVSDALVLAELNRKLYQLLPIDRFMAAILVTISADGQELRWWNGGMPSGWLSTQLGPQELTAHSLPLGILPNLPLEEAPRRVRVCEGDRLLLMSDGLLEAQDREGEMFVTEHFPRVLEIWQPRTSVLAELRAALDAHVQGTDQADDIAVLDIPIGASLFARHEQAGDARISGDWALSLTLEGERIKIQPTIDALLGPLGLASGLRKEMAVLETILTELYSNALEHGILKLSSATKATPEGFDAFYRERARRLADGCADSVAIRIELEPIDGGGALSIRVCDSGEGFSEADIQTLEEDVQRPWGRGIPLLKELCESLRFSGNGSQVEAVYRW